MAQPGQASIIYDSGFQAAAFTSSLVDTSAKSFLAVEVIALGAAAPTLGRVQTQFGATQAQLVLPGIAGVAVNYIGPMTGTNVANAVGYFTGIVGEKASFQATPGAASSVRIVVTGR